MADLAPCRWCRSGHRGTRLRLPWSTASSSRWRSGDGRGADPQVAVIVGASPGTAVARQPLGRGRTAPERPVARRSRLLPLPIHNVPSASRAMPRSPLVEPAVGGDRPSAGRRSPGPGPPTEVTHSRPRGSSWMPRTAGLEVARHGHRWTGPAPAQQAVVRADPQHPVAVEVQREHRRGAAPNGDWMRPSLPDDQAAAGADPDLARPCPGTWPRRRPSGSPSARVIARSSPSFQRVQTQARAEPHGAGRLLADRLDRLAAHAGRAVFAARRCGR